MMNDHLAVLVTDIADRLEYKAMKENDDRQTNYTAAKLLRAFNDLFAPTWQDVNFAEQMRKDREADRKAGRPWNGDQEG